MIKINSLHKFYNKNKSNEIHVINDVSLELPSSGMVAIFGRSGCGKTTLLNAIGGLDKTNSGEILVDGENIAKNTDILRNKHIGYIFQNYILNVIESCYDNVADALRLCGISAPEVIKTRTLAALRNVGMEAYKLRKPDTLSGGQMQRIAIARAIVKNPRIILADEPTGNLDEANTVMIMDLLKQIAKSHLVILVTHEANLVDHYCDRVIELADGRMVGDTVNEGANGYASKNKNDIYLGELDKIESSSEKVDIEYYGNGELPKIKLRLVSYGGKTYLQVDSPGVQILDSTSEIKLREGVYHSESSPNELSENIDMSDLPPIEGKKFGRLFGFWSSIKSGYESVFSNRKKKRKGLMRGCMALFACAVVVISAVQGTFLRDILNIKAENSENIFYVYTGNGGDVADRLISSVGTNGIDYMRIKSRTRSDGMTFNVGSFETSNYYISSISARGDTLPLSLMSDPKVVAGSTDVTTEYDAVITTELADKIIENSSVSFIEEYGDLLGLKCGYYRVKAVVEGGEAVMYVNDLQLASTVMLNTGAAIQPASKYGLDVKPGESVFITDYGMTGMPVKGETIKLFGHDFKVSDVLRVGLSYDEYLKESGYTDVLLAYQDYYSACFEKVAKENPDAEDDMLYELAKKLYEDTYIESKKAYYQYFDAYIAANSLYNYQYRVAVWASEKYNFDAIKYTVIGDEEFACAEFYKYKNGEYPSYKALQEIMSDGIFIKELYVKVENLMREFDSDNYKSDTGFYGGYVHVVSDADYIKCSQATGSSHDTVVNHKWENFSMIHSNDPKATQNFLEAEFADEEGLYGQPAVITPEYLFDEQLEQSKNDILASFVTMAAVIAVLCVCVYFIMRSSLMGRVKEIGIYRAIGVSKKNLIFRFFIETLVLTTLTVFIGFFITSFILTSWINSSSLVAEILYLPIWMSGGILILLYAVCTVSGLLPIMTLLSKTPSEILAKYDI